MSEKILLCQHDGYSIYVLSPILEVWVDSMQLKYGDHESCGIMVGYYKPGEKEICVENVTTPGPKDIRKRNRFALRDPKHQHLVSLMHDESNGVTFYLGTWHTHPEKRPNPSGDDRSDWMAINKRNSHIPINLFVIVGLEVVRIEIKDKEKSIVTECLIEGLNKCL